MHTLASVPLHPLAVHVPVVLVPAGALLTVVVAASRRARRRYDTLVAAIAVIAAISAALAAHAGETLYARVTHTGPVTAHVHQGAWARNFSLLFALVVVAYVVVARRLDTADAAPPPRSRPRQVALVGLGVLAGVSGLVATAAVVRAGHSGAKVTWEQVLDHAPTATTAVPGSSGPRPDDAARPAQPTQA